LGKERIYFFHSKLFLRRVLRGFNISRANQRSHSLIFKLWSLILNHLDYYIFILDKSLSLDLSIVFVDLITSLNSKISFSLTSSYYFNSETTDDLSFVISVFCYSDLLLLSILYKYLLLIYFLHPISTYFLLKCFFEFLLPFNVNLRLII
jgi:hypothetical protein